MAFCTIHTNKTRAFADMAFFRVDTKCNLNMTLSFLRLPLLLFLSLLCFLGPLTNLRAGLYSSKYFDMFFQCRSHL